MSKVKIEGNASGTGTFTITSPNSSTDRTITLPDVTGNLISADASGNVSITGDLEFNSGYGSSTTVYGIRAWVNFNGTGTVAIRGSGNVSSITDQSTGQYVVNLTTAMPDTNYSATIGAEYNVGATTNWVRSFTTSSFVVTSYRVDTLSYADTATMTVNVAR